MKGEVKRKEQELMDIARAVEENCKDILKFS